MSTHLPVFTRGTTPYWTYPCGCQASALALTPCPLHAAAPRMLDFMRYLTEHTLAWAEVRDRARVQEVEGP